MININDMLLGNVYDFNTLTSFNDRVIYKTMRLRSISSYNHVKNTPGLQAALVAVRASLPANLININWETENFMQFKNESSSVEADLVVLPAVLLEQIVDATEFTNIKITATVLSQDELNRVLSALKDLNISYEITE